MMANFKPINNGIMLKYIYIFYIIFGLYKLCNTYENWNDVMYNSWMHPHESNVDHYHCNKRRMAPTAKSEAVACYLFMAFLCNFASFLYKVYKWTSNPRPFFPPMCRYNVVWNASSYILKRSVLLVANLQLYKAKRFSNFSECR